MEAGIVRGATLNEVKSKNFNIYLGISLGNKWFTKEHMKENLFWALKYTKSRVGLLVADTLHAINYEVRNDMSHENALRKAIINGDKIISILKEIIVELPKNKQNIIDIIRWGDVKNDEFNKEFIPILYSEFENNPEFRKCILNLVGSFTEKTREKLNEDKLKKLARYILDELPELLHGFTYKGTYYNCYTYPYDSQLTQFVEKIQKKELFPHLHEKLDIKNNIFVELK